MAKVLCFASAKGGSGKTTVTATFGKLFAEFGCRVLLLDCDDATNGLSLLYMTEINALAENDEINRNYLTGVFARKGLPDVVNLGPNLDICPANYSFELGQSFSRENFQDRLVMLTDHFGKDYDYILLDAEAGSDPVSLAAMSQYISDLVIIVSEYDPMSAAGIERLKGLASEALTYDRTWILLNKLLPEFVESFSEFLSVSHYLPPLPWTADAVRAYARRELALNFDSGNEFTYAALQSARALPISKLNEMQDKWSEEFAYSIREPISEQYDEIETLLMSSRDRLKKLENSKTLKMSFARILFQIIAIVPLFFIATNYFTKDLSTSKPFTSFFNLSFPDSTILVLAAVMFSLFTFISFSSASVSSAITKLFFNKGTDEFEVERLTRQQLVYQSKLEELEFLKAANSEELLKKKLTDDSRASVDLKRERVRKRFH